MSKTYTKVY